MTLVSRPFRATLIAVAVAAALSAPAALNPASAQAMSPAVGKPLQQAAAAAKAGNMAAANAAVNQARAAATTSAERTKVAQMAAYVHTRSGNYAKAAAELESIGAPASQLAPLYYQARQYDKAIAAAQKSGQTTIIAQSYLMQGNAAEAAKIYEQMVAKNPNNTAALQNLAGAQFKMGDRQAYLATVQKLVRLDPTPSRWAALLNDMKSAPMSRDAKLGLYHLMRETGTLTSGTDIQEFAKIAIVAGQPGVAASVVKAGSASGALPASDPMTSKLVDAAGKRQAIAIATAPTQAKTPATALAAGHAFFGADQLPQAIAAYSTAATGPRSAEAALFKGIAQLKSGQTAAAKASFAAVPAGGYTDLAGLWALYASTKG
jgi:tetratricopeptide (TPR) repeat protein